MTTTTTTTNDDQRPTTSTTDHAAVRGAAAAAAARRSGKGMGSSGAAVRAHSPVSTTGESIHYCVSSILFCFRLFVTDAPQNSPTTVDLYHFAYDSHRLSYSSSPSLSILGVRVCIPVLSARPPIYLAFCYFFRTLVLNRSFSAHVDNTVIWRS